MTNFKNIGVTDKLLFFSIIIISIFGLTLLYSATNQDIDIIIRQGVRLSFCFILMIIISLIDINKIKLIAPYIYLACIFLLIFTIFWGHDSKGAKRWIIFFGFSLQVSEIIKIVLPIFLAWFLSLSEDKEIDLKKLLLSFTIIFLPIIFIIKQPDLGTSLIVLLCGLISLFLGGVSKRHISYLSGLFLILIPLVWKFLLLPYQKQRIMTLIDPSSDPLGSGYHIIQSKIAVGSGGFFGKGFLNGTQSQLEFLPERGTDFIFSVLAEEFGFFGILILFLFYFIIIVRCIHITSKAKTYFSKILSGSITCIFLLLILTNIFMTIGVLPVVGVTLPLLSLGGSSLLSIFIAFGIMFSINRRS
ncbi:rod shape-determining protein RodA [Gammaproteobacteria bacterium]|nr:rod shape-determining protein RodA [Gammaproteobacteria bacterium]